MSNGSGNREISTGPYKHNTRNSKKKDRERQKILHDKIILEVKSNLNVKLQNTKCAQLKPS
jgi:hypothetical protein